MRHITEIRVTSMEESCERTTFYVQLTTDEGFTITPSGHCTGHRYKDWETGEIVVVPGLSLEEARDRALTDAYEWGDLLEIPVEPFTVDGEAIQPSFAMETYTTRRELAARKRAVLQPDANG